MRWKPEMPRFIRARTAGKPFTKRIRPTDPGHLHTAGRRISLQLTIRGETIEMSVRPCSGVSFAIEEIARGCEPSHISLFLDRLTSVSPSIWLAAVRSHDVEVEVAVKESQDAEKRTFRATIVGDTIVPLRALFASAGITMLSGCSLDLRVMEGSGPLRVFRQVQRVRRTLN